MEPVLKMENISKNFPGVRALEGVSIEIFPHEIVGIVGENGAGKSTLMKILAGVYQSDRGEILLRGQRVEIKNPYEARALGIGMVFQEQAVLPNMMVYENIFLGREKTFIHNGFLDRKTMLYEAKKILQEVGVDISLQAYLHELNFMERQMVEIARNIWLARQAQVDNPLIILDEPTTVLEEEEIKRLFDKLRELKKKVSFIYISHRLKEVVELCDRVYVLKDGKNAGCFSHEEVTEEILRSRMVGREFHEEYYLISKQRKPAEKVVLEIRDCTKKGSFYNVSFQLHQGEILSLCGTVGSGKEELCRVLYGETKLNSGEIWIDGKRVNINSPSQAFALGIGYISEDRRNEGLILHLPVFENITLPIIRRLIRGLLIKREEQFRLSQEMMTKLQIKAPSPLVLCFNLSGGNQQKVVIAKWLLSNMKILIMSHPTRGVDVGAKHEIYALIRELAENGMAMIIMGDSFEEDIGLANRILVMKDGKISGVLDATILKPTPTDLIQYVV